MPNSAHIDYVELPVTDISATKDFYADVFGWVWIDYGPGYAGSTNAGIEVGLNTLGTVGPAHAPGEENGVGPLVLFSTDDLSAVEASVLAAGGTIMTPAYGYPGGRRFHFADPSGNILGIYQPDATAAP